MTRPSTQLECWATKTKKATMSIINWNRKCKYSTCYKGLLSEIRELKSSSLLTNTYIFRIGFSCTSIRRECHLNHVVSPADVNYFITQHIMKNYKTVRIIPPYFYILCGIRAAYMFFHRWEYFINWLLLRSENLLSEEQPGDYEWRHKVTYSQHCKYKNYSHRRLLSCGLCKQVLTLSGLFYSQNNKVWFSLM